MRPLLTSLLIGLLASPLPTLADGNDNRLKTANSFTETREALILAIENRGLTISYTSHIADMLRRTGKDIGESTEVFKEGESIGFCSARLSRLMLASNPHDIVHCPFAVAVYTLPGENGTWLSYRPPHGEQANQIEKLLREIINEAAQ